MRTVRRVYSREPRSAQAIEAVSQDTGKLPPWLKDAQENAVVAKLRRKLEARGDKPCLGNNAERVPFLVQDTSKAPEAGSTATCPAHCMKATEKIVDGPLQIDTVDVNNGPIMGKNEITTCAKPAEKEADRLRMELTEVKGKLGDAEIAVTKLSGELWSSQRELKVARDVALQLAMQMDALANDMEGNSIAMESVARSVEMELAAVQTELEIVKAELAGKTSELNETKPQLEFARTQLRIFQEKYAPTSGQVKPAEVHVQQADVALALVEAKLGAMNNPDVNQPTEFVPSDSQADQISKVEAELDSASNAQAVLQDAW